MTYNCDDCSYDRLFVKEVIISYCGQPKKEIDELPPVVEPPPDIVDPPVDEIPWTDLEPAIPIKKYLSARDEYSPSAVLRINDWKTVGAWKLTIDGEPYQFKEGESLYDALVSLYSLNVAYPHRTDSLAEASSRTIFRLYNNNAHLVSLVFNYTGSMQDDFENLISVEDTSGGTEVQVNESEQILQLDLAGSKHAYVPQAFVLNVDWSNLFLSKGNFFVLTINDVDYRLTAPLEELKAYNSEGLATLYNYFPELYDLVEIERYNGYTGIANKTAYPLFISIRLDRDMPFYNGKEEVWSPDNIGGVYLPYVPEIPQNDEDAQFYPYGVIQETKSVPISVSEEGYYFELAPALPEPLTIKVNPIEWANSRTRDTITITGTVNREDAIVTFEWDEVVYTATVKPEKVEGKYEWIFSELSYDIFEKIVNENPDGKFDVPIKANNEQEEAEGTARITYYKPTIFITPITSHGYIQHIAGRNMVIDWGDGVLEEYNHPTAYGALRHDYEVPGNYTITIDRFNDPRGLLWIARNTVRDADWSTAQFTDNGIKEIVQWESTGYVQIGAGSWTLEKLPNHPPPNTTNFAGFLQGSVTFNQDLSTWETIYPRDARMAFQGCRALTSLPPMSVVECSNFSCMFQACYALEPDVSEWNMSKATNLDWMFAHVWNFNSDVSGWDVSKVTIFSGLFRNTKIFNVDISGWDVSSGTNFTSMFASTHAFNQPLNNWDVSNAVRMDGMFQFTRAFNQPLDKWTIDTDKTSLGRMFAYAVEFNSDISTWMVRESVDNMFSNTGAFNQPIGNWPVKHKRATTVATMFDGAKSFYQDISSWQVNYPETTVRGSLLSREKKVEWYPTKINWP